MRRHKHPVNLPGGWRDPQAIIKGLDFVADRTDAPLIVDSADLEVRLAGLSHASEQFGSRTMYNAINMTIGKPEIDALSRSQIEGVVIPGSNMHDPSVKARIEILEDGGGFVDKGLLEIAKGEIRYTSIISYK